jgi:hypothetical protein
VAAVITDDILGHFVVEGTWDELPARIVDRCALLTGHDVHVVLYLAGTAAHQRGDAFDRFGDVARALAG